MKVLEQTTRVHCFAEEICEDTTKRDWQPCTYQLYRWQMDQEVSHLYALFGGPEEDEVRVKGQRLAKTWMNKAIDGIERARKHIGLRFRGTSELDGPRQCHHEGPPMESRPYEIQARAATRRADRAWRKRPRRIKGLCGGLTDGANESGGNLAPAEGSEGESESSSDSSDSPATLTLLTRKRTRSHQGLKRESPRCWRPDLRALDCLSPSYRRLSLKTLAPPSPTRGSPTPSTWGQGEGARSPLAQAAPTPPPAPPIRKSRAQVASTRASPSRPHRTPRWISPPRHHPWRRRRNSAGR